MRTSGGLPDTPLPPSPAPRRVNNYFKSTRGDAFWFFDCTHIESIRGAWEAATAGGREFSCFKPFPMAGPWFGMNLIGYPHKPVDHDGIPKHGRPSDEDEIDRRIEMLAYWSATRNLRLISTGVSRV